MADQNEQGFEDLVADGGLPEAQEAAEAREKQQTPEEVEGRKALACLYVTVPEVIARDVNGKIMAWVETIERGPAFEFVAMTGCGTGDCPHLFKDACIDALVQQIAEAYAETARLTKRQEWIDNAPRAQHPDDERPWAAELVRMQMGLEQHADRILTALDNCMHEYGEDTEGMDAREWLRRFLPKEPSRG